MAPRAASRDATRSCSMCGAQHRHAGDRRSMPARFVYRPVIANRARSSRTGPRTKGSARRQQGVGLDVAVRLRRQDVRCGAGQSRQLDTVERFDSTAQVFPHDGGSSTTRRASWWRPPIRVGKPRRTLSPTTSRRPVVRHRDVQREAVPQAHDRSGVG